MIDDMDDMNDGNSMAVFVRRRWQQVAGLQRSRDSPDDLRSPGHPLEGSQRWQRDVASRWAPARWLGVAKLYESGKWNFCIHPFFGHGKWWQHRRVGPIWGQTGELFDIFGYVWTELCQARSPGLSAICKSPEVFIRKRYGGQTDPTAVKELIVSQLPIADHSNHPNHPIQWSKLIINHQTQDSIKLHPSPSPI